MPQAAEQDYEPIEEPAPPPAAAPSGRIPVSTSPTTYDPQTGRPTVTITKRPKATTAEDDYEPVSGDEPIPQTVPYHDISPLEAAAYGGGNILSFGLQPAIAGAAAAGAPRTPEEEENQALQLSTAPESAGAVQIGEGIGRLWNDHFGNVSDPQAREAYTQGRESMLNNQNLASSQHAGYYLLGQLGAALMMPMSAGRAAVTGFFGKILPGLVEGAAGRIGGAALTGGVLGAGQGAGEAVSKGEPENAPLEAGKGFATGAVLGGALGTTGEVASNVAGRIGTVVRGAKGLSDQNALDVEAGRRILEPLTSDIARFGPSMTPEQQAATRATGAPTAIVDVGQGRTRATLRAAVNTSPEGRQTAEAFLNRRFRQQAARIASFIRRRFGGTSTSYEQDVIDAHRAAFNTPMYDRAYAAGDRPIWSPEIERLTGDPDIAASIGKAARTGKSWAILDGMGGFNPSVRVTDDGQLIFNRGPTGVPTYPNIQFWDYAQRELNGKINEAKKANRTSDVTRLSGLRRLLLNDLDSQVPEFGQARQTASSFFGAENAVEAGENFVMQDFDRYDAMKMIAKFKPVEREIFARSFAAEFARKIEGVRDNAGVINQAFLDSPTARAKIEMALGPQGAMDMEAMLRSEEVLDKARKELGNSTTARQIAEMGLAGGGAVGAMEALKHTTLTGAVLTALAGATGVKAAAGKLGEIDENVSRRMAEMLVSDDPAVLDRAIKAMARSPAWMRVLRSATGAATRVGTPDIGFTNLAAGAMTAGEDIADIFKKEKKEPELEKENTQYQDQTQ